MENTQTQKCNGRPLTHEEMIKLDLDFELRNARNPKWAWEMFMKLGKEMPQEEQEKKAGQEIRLLEKYCTEGKAWLPIEYQSKIISFAYPPVRGTHQKCFEAISKDKELRAAEGYEFALVTHGAYTGKDEWKDIKQTCFQPNYIRAPSRHLWLPKGSIKRDRSLSGVLVERDLKGKGTSTRMKVPSDLSGWKEQDGIYTLGDLTFVPKERYNLGEMKENDGFAGAILNKEGVSIFIKTARDAKLTPYNRGINVNNIHKPVQGVALLGECYDGSRLCVSGDCCVGDGGGWAFGVSAAGEASAREKIQEEKNE